MAAISYAEHGEVFTDLADGHALALKRRQLMS